nr:hypothetical protein AOJQRVMU_AOJQRVMU_CDS_0009 [Microvirus sp.]
MRPAAAASPADEAAASERYLNFSTHSSLSLFSPFFMMEIFEFSGICRIENSTIYDYLGV